MKKTITKIKNLILKNKKKSMMIGLILITGAIIFNARFHTASTDVSILKNKKIEVIKLNDLGSLTSYVQASGKVESSSNANISAETSGVVKNVLVDVGDNVKKGQLLVSLSSEDASSQVAQANANLKIQEAKYLDLLNGTRKEDLAISTASLESSQTNLDNSKSALIDTIESSLQRTDDIFETKVKPLFIGGFGATVQQGNESYSIRASYWDDKVELEESYREIKNDLNKISKNIDRNINNETVVLISSETESFLLKFTKFLDLLSKTVNSNQSSNANEQAVYNTFIANISTARSSIQNSLTSIRNSVNTLKTSKAGFNVSDNQHNLKLAGASQTELEIQSAQVASAKATLSSANNSYNKTQIRAPFSGNITSFDITTGEFVSTGKNIISLVSENGKQISVFMSSKDATEVTVDSKAIINKKYLGFVRSIAKGIDPTTGKIEAKIQLEGDSQNLIIGEFVSAEIEIITNESSHESTTLLIPLSSVKAKTDGRVVYVVDEDKIKESKIVTGEIIGESIEVISGLLGDETIAYRAAGLKDGMNIEVINK